MKNLERVYIRLPNWIGDVCMSTPALQAAVSTGLSIVACGKPWARSLLTDMPTLQFLPVSGEWQQDRRQVREHIRRHPVEGRSAGLLLPDSLTSALAFRLAGLTCAGYRDDGRSLLLKWPFSKPGEPMHAVQSWYWLTRQAFAKWGYTLPAQPAQSLHLSSDSDSMAAASDALVQAGAGERPILIAPTATGQHKGKNKVWPHFDALTRRLQAQQYTVAMCPPEAELEQAKANAPTATVIAPLSLSGFVALVRQSSLVICNDSGVAHLASLTDTPQLTLMGVTDAARTHPWTPHAHILGSYGHWPSVEDVLGAVNQLLRNE